eukprot:2941527-Alexandrium_andersonii.AAC.1
MPLSHLWQKLQRLDADGKALFDAIDARASPFRAASLDLAAMLTAPVAEGPLAPVFHQFALEWESLDEAGDVTRAALVQEARRILASQIAQVWWRFIRKYEGFPFKLLQLVHP